MLRLRQWMVEFTVLHQTVLVGPDLFWTVEPLAVTVCALILPNVQRKWVLCTDEACITWLTTGWLVGLGWGWMGRVCVLGGGCWGWMGRGVLASQGDKRCLPSSVHTLMLGAARAKANYRTAVAPCHIEAEGCLRSGPAFVTVCLICVAAPAQERGCDPFFPWLMLVIAAQ